MTTLVRSPSIRIFQGVSVQIVDRDGQQWLTMADCARCLYDIQDDETVASQAVHAATKRLYSENSDEFEEDMTALVELPTRTGLRSTRVFSLRGAHLLGMLARTEKAKAFRRWILDMIEMKAATPEPTPLLLADPRAQILELPYDREKYALVRAWFTGRNRWVKEVRYHPFGEPWWMQHGFRKYLREHAPKIKIDLPEFTTLMLIIAREDALAAGLERDTHVEFKGARIVRFRAEWRDVNLPLV